MTKVLLWKNEGRFGSASVAEPAALSALRPYGSNPADYGIEDLGFLTKSQAKAIAKERGLKFEQA
jgi:hypothetical protein